jgi:outer membrane protein assembly factor BamB
MILLSYFPSDLILAGSSVLIAWISYRLEKRKIPTIDSYTWKEKFQRNKKKIIITIIILSLFLLWYLPLANNQISRFITRQKSAIEHNLPGAPKFDRLSNFVVLDDTIFFSGETYAKTTYCDCVYAMDRQTQKILWSTGDLAAAHYAIHSDEYPESGDTTPHFSVSGFSPDKSVVYISVYRSLYAFDRYTGKMIWKHDTLDWGGYWKYKTDYIIYNDDGDLERVDGLTGKTKWVLPSSDNEVFGVSALPDTGLLLIDYYHNETETQIAITADTPIEQWREPDADTHANSEYLYDGDGYYSVTVSKNDSALQINGLNNTTGKTILPITVPIDGEFNGSSLALNHGKLYIFMQLYRQTMYDNSNQILCYDMQTGKKLWGTGKFFITGDIAYRFIDNNLIIGSDNDLKLMALDEDTGQKVWTSTITQPYTRLLLKDNVIVTVSEDALTGYDTASGKPLWKYDTGFAADDVWSKVRTLVDDDGHEIESNVYIFNESGRVAALDLTTGRELWHWEAPIDTSSSNHVTYDMGELTADYLTIYQRPNDNQVTVLSTDGKVLLTYK